MPPPARRAQRVSATLIRCWAVGHILLVPGERSSCLKPPPNGVSGGIKSSPASPRNNVRQRGELSRLRARSCSDKELPEAAPGNADGGAALLAERAVPREKSSSKFLAPALTSRWLSQACLVRQKGFFLAAAQKGGVFRQPPPKRSVRLAPAPAPSGGGSPVLKPAPRCGLLYDFLEISNPST